MANCMRFLCVLCAFVVSLSAADKKPLVKPDSAEEKALFQARTESDPARRLAMLDAFVQKFPESAPAAHSGYLGHYLETKEWEKALEYGRKAYEADNEDEEVPINLMKAALGKGDLAVAVEWGSVAGALMGKVLAKPENADDASLKTQRAQMEYTTFDAALRVKDPAQRAKSLEQLIAGFAGGNYAKLANAALAVAYQQAGDAAKMTASAEKALEVDPQNETMHLLLGETSLGQKRLDQATQHAQSVLKIFETKTRLESMAEADWVNYQKNYRGAAQSIIGRALMQQEKTEAAIPELKSAADLLAGNQEALAPVLYNLAFGYAKLKRLAEARAVLTRAVQIPGPFQKLSRDLAAKIK